MISVAVVCAIMLFSVAAYANNNGDENHAAAEQAFKAKIVKNNGHGKKVYFAGPMFYAAEKGFNLKVTQVLEEYGYQVFLPQRDGIEAAKLEGKTEEELIANIEESLQKRLPYYQKAKHILPIEVIHTKEQIKNYVNQIIGLI